MQTTIFEVKFPNGQTFRVYTANANQLHRFRMTLPEIEAKGGNVIAITNGIHNINQWEEIIKDTNYIK